MPSPRRCSRPDAMADAIRHGRRPREIARAVASGEHERARRGRRRAGAHRQAQSGAQRVHRGDGRARPRQGEGDRCARATRRRLPLAGVPFAVKNLFDIAGLATVAGSKINRARPPAERDSPLIERLEAAGAVLVGALNMGEYAYDFTGENVHDGPSRNPHDSSRMTGGSSGGSRRRGRRRAGAARARLRHQRLDPRAVVAVRHLRAEADLWPAVARAHISVRREPRSSRPVRALDARPRAEPTTPCRAPTRTIRPAPIARRSRRLPLLERGTERPAHRGRRRLFPARARSRRRWRRVARVAEGARAPATRSKFRKPRAPAPRPTSSPRPKARRCISTACARARAISIRRCATA